MPVIAVCVRYCSVRNFRIPLQEAETSPLP